MQVAIGLGALFALAALTVLACHVRATQQPVRSGDDNLWDAGTSPDDHPSKAKKSTTWVAIAASCGGCGGCGGCGCGG